MSQSLLTSNSIEFVIENLETLQQEHHLLISSSSIDNDDDDDDDDDIDVDHKNTKRRLIQQSFDSITLGIAEASMMLQFDKYFTQLDSETRKLILQVKRLTQENNWLRDELSETERHWQTSTERRNDYQREIHLLNETLTSLSISSVDPLNRIPSIDIEQNVPVEVKERPLLISKVEPNATRTHSDIPPRFRTLHNLVIQYAQAGRYEVAVPLCRQALEDLEKTHGHFHPDVATMLNILALVYRDQNKFKEALQLLTEALTIREKTLGFEHAAVAATLNNLAVLYGKKNRYKEAGRICPVCAGVCQANCQ
jgi:kinesin light chain